MPNCLLNEDRVREELEINIAKLEDTLKDKAILADREALLRENILNAMKVLGEDKVSNGYLTASYIAPKERSSVDSKLLSTQYPEIYEKCLKVSEVKESLRVRLG